MEDFSEKERDDFIDVETADKNQLLNINFNDVPEDPNFKPPEIDYDSIGEFCFESDELALKNNSDYKNMLEAIVILEAQKTKAVKDLELLTKMKNEALSDPFTFLERLQRKENLHFPVAQKIHTLPVIDWSKYDLSGNPSAFSKRQIYLQRQATEKFSRNAKSKISPLQEESVPPKDSCVWRIEEEELLRELLRQYPPESDEASRWEKIALNLGSRTLIEVATKVYNLHSIFMEDKEINVGKLPDLDSLKKLWNVEETQQNPKVANPLEKENSPSLSIDIPVEEDISLDLQDTPEYQELMALKNALRKKLKEGAQSPVQHTGYKCDYCKQEPITGVRWHCVDCSPPADFCEGCVKYASEFNQHTAKHQMECVRHATKSSFDRDYMQFLGANHNYLDPNYMPAT